MEDLAYTAADLTTEQAHWLAKLFHVRLEDLPGMFMVCESCVGGHSGNAERWLGEQIERAGYKLPSDAEDAEDEYD